MSGQTGDLYWYRAKLVRIVDGDTVRLDIDLGANHWIHNESVRLYGIDAPEVRGDDKELGRESAEYLACLLPQPGGDLIIRTHKDKRCSFGRLLGQLYVDGVDVNQRMIDEGYAVAYPQK